MHYEFCIVHCEFCIVHCEFCILHSICAGMVELADTQDLGSCAERCTGSTPATRTKLKNSQVSGLESFVYGSLYHQMLLLFSLQLKRSILILFRHKNNHELPLLLTMFATLQLHQHYLSLLTLLSLQPMVL